MVFQLLLVFICLIALIFTVGALLNYLLRKIKSENKLKDAGSFSMSLLFFDGLVFTSSLCIIIATKGDTIVSPAFLVYLFFFLGRNLTARFHFKLRDCLILSGILLFSFLFFVIRFSANGMDVQAFVHGVDFNFYSRLGVSLLENQNETIDYLGAYNGEAYDNQIYHFFELWQLGFISKITGIPGLIAMVHVVYPLYLFALLLIFFSWKKEFRLSNIKFAFLTLFLLLIPNFYFIGYFVKPLDQFPVLGNDMFLRLPKLLLIYYLFAFFFSIYRLSPQRYLVFFAPLIILSFICPTTLPAISFSIMLFLLIEFLKKRISFAEAFKLGGVVALYYLAYIFIVLFYKSNADANTFFEIKIVVKSNVLLVFPKSIVQLLLYLPTIFPIVYFLRKKQLNLKFIRLFIGMYIASCGFYVLFYNALNGYQFYYNLIPAFLLIFTIYVLFEKHELLPKKMYPVIGVLFAISLVFFFNFEPKTVPVTVKDKAYIQKILQVEREKNCLKLAYLFDENKLNVHSHLANTSLFCENNILTNYSNSVCTNICDIEAIIEKFKQEKKSKELHMLYQDFFLRFLQEKKRHYSTETVSAFLKANKIDIIFVDPDFKSIEIPQEFEFCMKDPLSGEKLYKRK